MLGETTRLFAKSSNSQEHQVIVARLSIGEVSDDRFEIEVPVRRCRVHKSPKAIIERLAASLDQADEHEGEQPVRLTVDSQAERTRHCETLPRIVAAAVRPPPPARDSSRPEANPKPSSSWTDDAAPQATSWLGEQGYPPSHDLPLRAPQEAKRSNARQDDKTNDEEKQPSDENVTSYQRPPQWRATHMVCPPFRNPCMTI